LAEDDVHDTTHHPGTRYMTYMIHSTPLNFYNNIYIELCSIVMCVDTQC
jgi:hypothetical protein